MAFWAMGAFDKVKNITEKLNMKSMGTKLISYVAVQGENKQAQEQVAKSTKKIEEAVNRNSKAEPSEKQLMEIQLQEYKKLIKLQEKIVERWRSRVKEELAQKQSLLQQSNRELILNEQKYRKQQERLKLISELSSGKKSIQNVIEQNILIKQQIFQAKCG